MKIKYLFCMAYLFCLTLSAQSRWTIGAHLGADRSNIVGAGFRNESDGSIRTPQYGFLVKYHLNQYWAIRVERNQAVRGRDYNGYRVYDSLGNPLELYDYIAHRSYFLTLPILLEGSVGQNSILQAAIGIMPMYQQNASVTLGSTGKPVIPLLKNPRIMNGHTQVGWIAKVGYSQKLYRQLHLYVEASYNLNWSFYETNSLGYYYAYSYGFGLTYRLPRPSHLLCEKLKG